MAEQRKRRKRGGLAGIWDRNKNVIKPLATLAAGAMTGGAALPALLGAGMSGLDRPGRGGVGFDVGAGARGALAGAGMGKLGQAARSGLQGLFTGGVGEQVTSAPVSQQTVSGIGPSSLTEQAVPGGTAERLRNIGQTSNRIALPQRSGGLGIQSISSMPGQAAGQVAGAGASTGAAAGQGAMGRIGSLLGGAAQFGRENASWLGPAVSGAAEFMGNQQTADIAAQRNRLEQQRFDRERQQQEALAQLLMPLFQQQARRVGGGMG